MICIWDKAPILQPGPQTWHCVCVESWVITNVAMTTGVRCYGLVPFNLTYPPTYVRTCIHSYIYTYVHAYIHTYIRTYMHTYIHIYVCTCIHTYIYTYVHAYICIYVHMYACAYISVCQLQTKFVCGCQRVWGWNVVYLCTWVATGHNLTCPYVPAATDIRSS